MYRIKNLLLALLMLSLTFPFLLPAQDDVASYNKILSEIEASSQKDSLYNVLGYIHIDKHQWSKAGDFFKKSIACNPANAETYNGLGLTYLKKAEYPIIPIEKIKKLFKVDNFSKAKKNFLKALKFNPDLLDAIYNLATNYLLQDSEINFQSSIDRFKELLTKDPLYKDADYMLGVAYRHAGDLYNAEKKFRNLIQINRSTPKAYIKLSDILMETSRTEEAAIMYYRGLEKLTDHKMIDDIYAEIEVLFTKDEKKEYKLASYAKKVVLIKKFWKSKDPTPSTSKNERYNIHFNRVSLARNKFSTLIPPYYDDRGKIYVKYGEPDNKYISEIYVEMIKPNESWTYEHSLGEGMVFDFVREGHSYWEVPTLEDAFHVGVSGGQSLYRDRAYLSPTYQRLAINFNSNNLIDFRAKKSLAHNRAPAEASVFKMEGKKLQFFYNFARFQTDKDKIKIEVYCAVPKKNLTFTKKQIDSEATLNYTIIFQDSNFTDIKKTKKTITLHSSDSSDDLAGICLFQENTILPPGAYRMGIRVENPESNSRYVYKHDFNLIVNKQKLALSDIELASSIAMSEQQDIFVKNGLKIIPQPYNIVQKETPVFTYFEVYNLLLDSSGKTDYTISYKIGLIETEHKGIGKALAAIGKIFSSKNKTGITSSYKRNSKSRKVYEYLSFDLSSIKPGIINLTITVTDNIIDRSISETISLRIVK